MIKKFSKVFLVLFLLVFFFFYIYGEIRDRKNKKVDQLMTEKKEQGFYEKYGKRLFDIFCAIIAMLCFWWLYVVIAIMVRIKLGSPVIFKQNRPGKDEKIFVLYKFRTMTDEKDENGELLSDEERLPKFGKWLRSTSLDELPEVINVLKGELSWIGPRPQLVRDMIFMTDEQRKRHTVRPGLSGLAQVNGRNAITWEDKLSWDLKYIEKITFIGDMIIILETVGKVFKRADINREGTVSDMDFGDYLLQKGTVSKEEYDKKQAEAMELLKRG